MNCPACTSNLVTLELNGVEVDYCFTCQGIWLDNGELERLLSMAEGDEGMVSGLMPAAVSEKRRRCPVCRRVMEKVETKRQGGVLLDRCDRHGLWFDRLELRKVLEMGCAPGVMSPLTRILDDMFAARGRGCV
ncbi:MAG TPA: zf-TFIIB domain-containing protein [Deltaproteobacteria bacterium]|nr:zf-TFIIB domain-containing protein [Deltaproteobacteria bacterium]HOM29508.1 zf-TFIIB domain-containing protein [Deltaproteobacteria bacterium]HPP81425.1 zf-TFIIB domain-containing protein [Deltaproteobacteria bacterium]